MSRKLIYIYYHSFWCKENISDEEYARLLSVIHTLPEFAFTSGKSGDLKIFYIY